MDFEPSELDAEIVEGFRHFLERECTMVVVRGAESRSFDEELWKKVRRLGVPSMGIPEGAAPPASLLQQAMLAELCGRYLAPIPVVESLAAIQSFGNSLSALRQAEHSVGKDLVAGVVSGAILPTVALHPLDSQPEQLIPAGGIADVVVGSYRGELLLARREDHAVHSYGMTHGGTALARWVFTAKALESETARLPGNVDTVLAVWRILTAAALVGLAERALEIGASYATSRQAFGTPIGKFQGVAHPLADSATALHGARLLTRKAAWTFDMGRLSEAVPLSRMSLGFTGESAMLTTARCLHVHGGYGSALEYDIQLYHQRARAWATVSGDPRNEFISIGRDLIELGIRSA